MNIKFFTACFFIGLSASCAMGPIFVLTFNRSAVYGFWHGFATAVGAALADGIFFGLGLLGALTLIESSKKFIVIMDILGAGVLFFLGIHTIRRYSRMQTVIPSYSGLLFSGFKAFVITIINPFIALFFMFISIQIVPDELLPLPFSTIAPASIIVALGSITMLSIIAFIASSIGNAISKERLSLIAYYSGFAFILVGSYFMFDFGKNILKMLNVL